MTRTGTQIQNDRYGYAMAMGEGRDKLDSSDNYSDDDSKSDDDNDDYHIGNEDDNEVAESDDADDTKLT